MESDSFHRISVEIYANNISVMLRLTRSERKTPFAHIINTMEWNLKEIPRDSAFFSFVNH